MHFNMNRTAHSEAGFTLLLSILITGVILAIGLAVLNITLKEFILSSIARESAVALNAADAGMECALYWDRSSNGDRFDVDASSSVISCMGSAVTVTGSESGGVKTHDFALSWGTPAVCAEVTVIKYYNPSSSLNMGDGRVCPAGAECTSVISRGYNRSCADLENPSTVERALRARY